MWNGYIMNEFYSLYVIKSLKILFGKFFELVNWFLKTRVFLFEAL
jgi:hypothetical protein